MHSIEILWWFVKFLWFMRYHRIHFQAPISHPIYFDDCKERCSLGLCHISNGHNHIIWSIEPYGLNQGSKSRKISYRAIVHDFVRGQKFYRARIVHEKNRAINEKSCKNRANFEVFIWSLNICWIEYILHDFYEYYNEVIEFDRLKFWIRQKRRW